MIAKQIDSAFVIIVTDNGNQINQIYISDIAVKFIVKILTRWFVFFCRLKCLMEKVIMIKLFSFFE